MSNKLTAGRALAQQRRNVKRKIGSELRGLATRIDCVILRLEKYLSDWISDEDERYNKRPGGLGKKRK